MGVKSIIGTALFSIGYNEGVPLLSLISFITGLIFIGLVAGFSIVLYAMQITVLGNKNTPFTKGVALTSGVASGLGLLIIVFALIQPETFHAPSLWELVSGHRTNTVDVILGIILIISGGYVLLRGGRRIAQVSPQPPRSIASSALFGIGFGRSITRITGVAALLLGVRTSIHATDAPIVRLLLLIVLFAAALAPYILILIARLIRPSVFARVEYYVEKTKKLRSPRIVSLMLIAIGVCLLIISFLPVVLS